MKKAIALTLLVGITGCASIDFNAKDGAVYYEPVPYLFYSQTDKCVRSVSAVSLPGEKRHLDFKTGYGSYSLSAKFSNGLLTEVGQTSDSKLPETLTSFAALGTAGLLTDSVGLCSHKAILYPIKIKDGSLNLGKPLHLTVDQ